MDDEEEEQGDDTDFATSALNAIASVSYWTPADDEEDDDD